VKEEGALRMWAGGRFGLGKLQHDLDIRTFLIRPHYGSLLRLPSPPVWTGADRTQFASISLRRVWHPRGKPPHNPYRCDTCGRAFARSDSLAVHLSTHTGGKHIGATQRARLSRGPIASRATFVLTLATNSKLRSI